MLGKEDRQISFFGIGFACAHPYPLPVFGSEIGIGEIMTCPAG